MAQHGPARADGRGFSQHRDMTRYLTMHMQGGTFEGREIIRRADSREMQMPQMTMTRPMTTEANEFPELTEEAYAGLSRHELSRPQAGASSRQLGRLFARAELSAKRFARCGRAHEHVLDDAARLSA